MKKLKLADSHVHLTMLSDPLEKILEDCENVDLLVNIGTLLEDDFSQLVKEKKIYCTYGIHPNDYLKENSSTKSYLEEDKGIYELGELLEKKIQLTEKCVGIGETGLDFFYGEKENPIQYKLLHIQLALARKLNKPLSIHARGCNLKELIKIINNYGVRFLLHCYTYDLETAMLAIEHGGYISFSGVLTFEKKVEDLIQTAKFIPEERILIETDAPYLAPTPYRGKKNHPKYLIHTLEKLAEIRGEPLEKCGDYTYKNTLKFYNIKDS